MEKTQNSCQSLVNEMHNAKGYDLNVPKFDTKEVDHPKGTILTDDNDKPILDSAGNKQIVQVKQFKPTSGEHSEKWFYQGELHSLVIPNDAFRCLQLDEDIIPLVESESGDKIRTTHKVTWIKSDIINLPIHELTEQIKGDVMLTGLSIKMLKIEDSITNMAKNGQVKFSPKSVEFFRNMLVPKIDTAFNVLQNKAENAKTKRSKRAPKLIRFVAVPVEI